MNGFWSVSCLVRQKADGIQTTTRVPTFFLDPSVQGILDQDGAVEVARRIVDPLALLDPMGLEITVAKL